MFDHTKIKKNFLHNTSNRNDEYLTYYSLENRQANYSLENRLLNSKNKKKFGGKSMNQRIQKKKRLVGKSMDQIILKKKKEWEENLSSK